MRQFANVRMSGKWEDSISIHICSFLTNELDVTGGAWVSLSRFEARKPYRELTANG